MEKVKIDILFKKVRRSGKLYAIHFPSEFVNLQILLEDFVMILPKSSIKIEDESLMFDNIQTESSGGLLCLESKFNLFSLLAVDHRHVRGMDEAFNIFLTLW